MLNSKVLTNKFLPLLSTVLGERRLDSLIAQSIGDALSGLSFWAPLQNTLRPSFAAGSPTPTFTRATTAYVTDFEGLLKPVLSGEARFTGARRVYNLIPTSTNLSDASWGKTANGSATIPSQVSGNTYRHITGGTAPTDYTQILSGVATSRSGDTVTMSVTLSADAATTVFLLLSGSTTDLGETIAIGTTPIRYSRTVSVGTATSIRFAMRVRGSDIGNVTRDITFTDPQLEIVTGHSNQAPGEPVSVGVLSAPYHGAGVDGVKYFSTLNGNTVSSNVVTEATGAAINSSNAKFGVSGPTVAEYFSTPSSSASQITDDIDIRIHMSMRWSSSGSLYLMNKGTAAYALYISGANGKLNATFNSVTVTSDAALTTVFADYTAHWIRVTRAWSTGTVTFYTSDDGSTWTTFGTTKTASAGNHLPTDASAVALAGNAGGAGSALSANYHRAQIYNGINGTLAVDFNPNTFASGTTWTSATTGETWTINGNAKVFGGSGTSSIQAPWNASGPFGYLAEGQRTNLALQSQTLGTTWVTANVTVTADQTTAPDGTATADLLTASAAAAVHAIYQSPALVSDTYYAVSAYVKPGTAGYFYLNIQGAANNYASQVFNLSGAGATGESSVGATSGTILANSAFVTALSGGWFRVGFVAKVTHAGTVYLLAGHAKAATGNTFDTSGQITDALASLTSYPWGIQAETASFASSYIPTTTASVTRNADVLSYAASGNISNLVGASYAEVVRDQGVSASFIGIIGGATTYPLYISSPNKLSIYDGTNDALSPGFTASSSVQKFASKWKSGGIKAFANGTAGTGTSFDGDMGVTTLYVGNANGGTQLFGTVRNVQIFNRPQSDAYWTARTTP